jgi:HEXXH motif-containing protein
MTDYHSLSDEQFHALARGTGGAEEISVLRSGQASKHLVMLLAILDLVKDKRPDLLDDADSGLRLLDSAQRAAPDAAGAVVAHPQFGLWAARCLRQLSGNLTFHSQPIELELGQLGAFAAVAAVRAGLSFEVTVPLRDGTVFLPTLGVARVGSGGADVASIVHRDGVLRIRSCGKAVTVPADPATDGADWVGLRYLTGDLGGRTASVELADLGPARDGSERTNESRLDATTIARWQHVFAGACRILTDDHPVAADAIATGLVGFLPLANQGEDFLFSATMRDAFGYLESQLTDDPLALAETLVHEFQHSKMYGIVDLFPLEESNGAHIHFAPWRQDPRPIPGLLQGTHAFLGVTQFWFVQQRGLTGTRRDRAYFEFARWRHQVASAIDALLASGDLTEAGIDFAQTMRLTAAQWDDESVPTDIQRRADRLVAEHRHVWRLANLRPAAAAVRVLAEDRVAGRPCSVDHRDIARVIESDGIARKAERLTLTQLKLSDPHQYADLLKDPEARTAAGFGDIGPADLAYLDGDFHRAAELFAEAISADPTRYQNWSGLAVCLTETAGDGVDMAALDSLDVLYAVSQEIVDRTGDRPGLRELAGWLAAVSTLEPAARTR